MRKGATPDTRDLYKEAGAGAHAANFNSFRNQMDLQNGVRPGHSAIGPQPTNGTSLSRLLKQNSTAAGTMGGT